MAVKMLNWSCRDHLFKSSRNGWLLYAGNSSSFIALSDEFVAKIENYKKGNEFAISGELLKKFVSMGILLRESDEVLLNIIKMKSYKSKSRIENLGLTICPFNQCNFDCVYCYEEKNFRKDIMSNKTVVEIIRFIKSFDDVKGIYITLYGGEPLPGLKPMKYLVSKLKKPNLDVEYYIMRYQKNIIENNNSREYNV